MEYFKYVFEAMAYAKSQGLTMDEIVRLKEKHLIAKDSRFIIIDFYGMLED